MPAKIKDWRQQIVDIGARRDDLTRDECQNPGPQWKIGKMGTNKLGSEKK